jgi:double-strand break repair protein MRE11
LLLGGDLFHEHTPSQNAYYKCSKIFNKHVFGDRVPQASQADTHHRRQRFETYNFPKANYLDGKH